MSDEQRDAGAQHSAEADTNGYDSETSAPEQEADDSHDVEVVDMSRFEDGTEDIDLNHCRARGVPDLARFTCLQDLCLRNNLLKSAEGIASAASTLTALDLYDNQLDHIDHSIGLLVNLERLDLSYNRLRKIENLGNLEKLRSIYFVHNKITTIEGLDALVNLELLELGDNRIRKVENIGHLIKLRELYLGKNKIVAVEGIGTLGNMRILSFQDNRLCRIAGLDTLVELEELYLSENGISKIENLDKLVDLQTLDLAHNRIVIIENVSHMQKLTDLWMNNNQVPDMASVLCGDVASMRSLRTIYVEQNPVSQGAEHSSYRRKLIMAAPQLTQIDAMPCRADTAAD